MSLLPLPCETVVNVQGAAPNSESDQNFTSDICTCTLLQTLQTHCKSLSAKQCCLGAAPAGLPDTSGLIQYATTDKHCKEGHSRSANQLTVDISSSQQQSQGQLIAYSRVLVPDA